MSWVFIVVGICSVWLFFGFGCCCCGIVCSCVGILFYCVCSLVVVVV